MKILYSRTSFMLGLKAGGSVGHTAGVLSGLSDLAQVEIISNEPVYGVEDIPCEVVRPIGRGWRGELPYNLRFGPHLAAKIRAFRPDFVYHRYSGYSFATARVCRRLGTPLVLEFNSSALWQLRHWDNGRSIKARFSRLLRRPTLGYTEPFILNAACLIVVVSDALKKSLVSQGFVGARILVNPNAVDPKKFKPATPKVCSRIKEQLRIPPRKIVVGFSGTFGLWHGIPELAEAILQLNADLGWRGKLIFMLCGDGGLRPMIEDKIGHFDNVRFTGIVEYEHMQDYLSICDILLSPHGKTPDGREFFGSPTKLFEYMAMGKGIVASDLDQIGEVLEHGKTAILVEPGSVDELVEGIIYLADHPQVTVQLGQNARRVVVERHTWRQNATRVIEAFEQIREHGKMQDA